MSELNDEIHRIGRIISNMPVWTEVKVPFPGEGRDTLIIQIARRSLNWAITLPNSSEEVFDNPILAAAVITGYMYAIDPPKQTS